MRRNSLLALAVVLSLAAADQPSPFSTPLSNDEKISHALNRLTFGPRPGDFEEVKKMGLKKWIDLEQRSQQQAKAAGVTIVTDFDRKPFEAAMAGIYQKTQRDPAAAALIERIRKVE